MAFTTTQIGDAENFPFSLTISDPHIEDNPLVYINHSFERLTGYSHAAVVGRNCRFLQGPDTDEDSVARIREAVEEKRDIQIDIRNYKADGTAFWNRLMLGPLFDSDGELRYFVGIQHQIDGPDTGQTGHVQTNTDDMLAEIQHRVKNHLSMVVGMIRMQARNATAEGSFESLARRVEALQMLYNEMSEAGAASVSDDTVPLGAYLTRIASAISHLDGRESIRVIIDADAVDVPVETAARAGLVFSEILTNCLQHAFEDRNDGVVEARSKMLSDDILRISIMDDGVGIPEGVDWPNDGNLGSRIVDALVKSLEADLSVNRQIKGTLITLDVPLGSQPGE